MFSFEYCNNENILSALSSFNRKFELKSLGQQDLHPSVATVVNIYTYSTKYRV